MSKKSAKNPVQKATPTPLPFEVKKGDVFISVKSVTRHDGSKFNMAGYATVTGVDDWFIDYEYKDMIDPVTGAKWTGGSLSIPSLEFMISSGSVIFKFNKLKTAIPASLNSVEEVKAFFDELNKNNESFHPDDPADTIIDGRSGEPLFNVVEAIQIDKIIEQAFDLCKDQSPDIYELMLGELVIDEE